MARVANEAEGRALIAEFAKEWKPIIFKVNESCFYGCEEKDDPLEACEAIPFGTALENYVPSIPAFGPGAFKDPEV